MPSWFWLALSFLGTADANRPRNSWSKPLLRGVKLQSTDAISKESLSEARKASKQAVANRDLSNCQSCRSKDFSNPCPESWSIQEESCRAPPQYKGPCATVQTFIGDSADEKREVEIMCKVCWPCSERQQCERNLDLPCPYGYSASNIPFFEYALANQTCVSDFQNECEATISFSTLEEKQEFVERCETQFPCREHCAKISAICPQGWINVGNNLCVAPDNYKPAKFDVKTCPLVNDFSSWSVESKNSAAKLCQFTWTCDQNVVKDGAIESHHIGKAAGITGVTAWQIDLKSGPIQGNGEIMGA